MKRAGVAIAIGGVAVAFASLLMTTSVHNPGDYRYGSYTPSSDVLNIGLLQNQQLVFLAGCTLFLAGVILFAAGAITEALVLVPRRWPIEVPSADGLEAAVTTRTVVESSTPSAVLSGAKKDKQALMIVGSVGALVLLAIIFLTLR